MYRTITDVHLFKLRKYDINNALRNDMLDNKQHYIDLLSGVQFFKELDRERLEVILGWFDIELFVKNDIVYDIDDDSNSLYVLLRGGLSK